MRSGACQTSVPAPLKRQWQTALGGKLSSVAVAGNMVFLAAVDAHTVVALDAGTGKNVWSYTVGGRVDSPPTIYRGRVLFGSADGWVYCLQAADGRLVWRFRAAPEDRRMVAYEQLESVWPVSGSVLIEHNVAYFVAGRSAFLDGGMRLVRLDPHSGRKLSETVIDDRDPETGKDLQDKINKQDMPVALPDILSCDGHSVYMRSQAFDLEGKRRTIAPLKLAVARRRGRLPDKSAEPVEIRNHLFSRSGFLDDSWFWRSYWIYGKEVDGNYGGWFRPGHFAPCGRLMVFDDACVYGFDRKPEYLCNASVAEYYLYQGDRQVSAASIQRVQKVARKINAASPSHGAEASDWAVRKKFSLAGQNAVTFHWAEGNPSIRARAMVLAGRVLWVAGPPDVVDEEEALRHLDDPAIQAQLAAQAAALRGRQGGQLLMISAVDGKELAAYELGAMPTFDGMAAANGRLYLTTVDGKVICLGGAGTPLPALPHEQLVPLDVGAKPPASEPGPQTGPSRKAEFAHVASSEITRSDLGYHLLAEGDATGLALKKLPPLRAGKISFKMRMRVTADGDLRNGFLVFGDSPEEARLVKCGLRFAAKKAMIVQGPLSGGRASQQPFDADETKLYTIDVSVELSSGRVTMQAGQITVTAVLTRPLSAISYVGYAAENAAADFSPIEISAK
jgi:outer membrane protein assembly factor BamB